MKFVSPVEDNPVDQLRIVGLPIERIDGRSKAAGEARYTLDLHDVIPGQAVGYPICSGIATGRIISMDLARARQVPGVIAIVTADTVGQIGQGVHSNASLLGGPLVEHYHQALGLVVAETFEQARAAAGLVKIEYEARAGEFDLSQTKDNAVPGKIATNEEPDSHLGDFASAFAEAPFRIDEHYETPDQSAAMIEPHASIAAWDGDRLTVWTAAQVVGRVMDDLPAILGIPRDNIRLIAPPIGGGFGGKSRMASDLLLAILGARAVGRPVRVSLPRAAIFNNTTRRPATLQRIRIGATADGRITALAHDGWSGDLHFARSEPCVLATRQLYGGANRQTTTRLSHLDLPKAGSMRAPGEASGLMALEIAIDEMAEKLGMDPVEFRIKNDVQHNPEVPTRPFTIRQANECLRVGAKQFDWHRRSATPGGFRDGNWHIGMGVALGIRQHRYVRSGARVQLDNRGIITVETDMTDIGTGSLTIIAQVAAEAMGVNLNRVVVRLGDSDFPRSPGSVGQLGASHATAGVYAACVKLREAIMTKLRFNSEDAQFLDGCVCNATRTISLAEAASEGPITVEDFVEYGENIVRGFDSATFVAHFVKTAVHTATAEIKVLHMLAVCAAGRILNPKLARSQVVGGMTMGIGAALMEGLSVDKNIGYFVNHDLASYEVPVHADIPRQDVIFIEETDPLASPVKAKGVGELGLCGTAAAIANSIHNAVGVRIRSYPITSDKIIAALPRH